MPYVNVKYVKQQVNQEQKDALITGLMEIIVKIMGRNPDLTVITIDEIDQSNWIIGGKSVDKSIHDKVSFIEIRISKGTTNYFIINELNPDSWGFDGISMTIRNLSEENK
jgi:4-oxalocrotonate tautomerase